MGVLRRTYDKPAEPFDAFVRRCCPDEADLILAEVERLRGVNKGTLVDFCAHLESHCGLRVPVSWAAMVDAFLTEYDEEVLDE